MPSQIGATPLRKKQPEHERVRAAIEHFIAEGRYQGGMLPSYRQLVRDLNVTMGSVRRAMATLEREGIVQRESGRGTVLCPRSPAIPQTNDSRPIECVNFVTFPAVRPSFVEADYLTGYTEALENLNIRMRFVIEKNMNFDSASVLAPNVPPTAQGVVFINVCPPDLMEWLRSNDVPFVVQCFSSYVGNDLPAHFGVYVNKPGGAFQAVNHLLELGHRHIGYMGVVHPLETSDPHVPFPTMVFEGYRAALLCAGIDYVESNIADCGACYRSIATQRDEVFALAKEFLNRPNRPSAIFAGCDDFALALLDAARELKIRVPEDLSIIGLNDQPGSEQTDPPLSTISIPRCELAKNAIELLLDAATMPRPQPQTRILETHLIIRETTAPPPNNK